MPKLIALYLPQYHEIEENNKWWGKGHTEWVSCKKAEPLFKGHYQPRTPLGGNYYNLENVDVQIEQAKLAKKYGIHAFCYYHYWFEGKLLLEKPSENMLKNIKVDIPFCFSWANHSWYGSMKKRNSKNYIIMEQKYGDYLDWKNHFYYLLPFFKDERYIKVDGKPMLIIYNARDICCWDEMQNLWNHLALKEGLKGIHYVSTLKHQQDVDYTAQHKFDAQFEYQPRFALRKENGIYPLWFQIKSKIYREYLNRCSIFNYDKVLNCSINTPKSDLLTYLGAFNSWDTTARWAHQGFVIHGSTPEKFEMYLRHQILRSQEMNRSEYIFITAWNEWSEGAYLEPDEKYKYEYLEAIKRALQ